MGEGNPSRKHAVILLLLLFGAVVSAVLWWLVRIRGMSSSTGAAEDVAEGVVGGPPSAHASGTYLPRDDLFGSEPIHVEWWDDVMAMRLEVMNDPAHRPPPCQPFGSVRWPDGSPVPRARIEMLTNKRTGVVGGSTWVDTGIGTDEQGDYELPPQEICPLRLAAETTDPRPGRGEEYDPPGEGDLPFRIRRDIVLEEACTVEGTVRSTTGEPLDAQVAADPSHYLGEMFRGVKNAYSARHPETRGRYFSYTTQSHEDGSFLFPSLLSGDWTIFADREGHRPAFVELHWDDDGACPDHAAIELEPDTCWTIFVHDEQGRPISGAYNSVVATMRTDRSSLSSGEVVYSDAEGLAEVCGTTPRGSFVESTAPGYTWEGTHFHDGDTLLDVLLHPAGVIEAHLPPSTPDDARVNARATHESQGRSESVCLIRSLHLRCETVPAGNIELQIKIGGYEAWTKAFTMPAGETVDLGELDLVPIPGEPYQQEWSIDPWSL